MREPLKAKLMIDYLREQIISGQMPPGGRLPPLRTLMAKFSVSFNTAKRGIDYLVEMGLVETRAQSGVYVKTEGSSKKQRARKIALFISPEAKTGLSGIFTTVFLGIQKAAEQSECALELHFVGIKDISQQKIDEVIKQTDGMILLAEYDSVLTDLKVSIPVVGVCMQRNYNGKISLLDLDYFQAAELAVDYFRQHHVKKVMAIVDPQRRPAYLQRATQFVAAWQADGGEAEIGLEPESFDSHCGYWFATGSLLQAAADNYRKNGQLKRLSEQHVVLGVDGKRLLVPDFEPAPTLAADWQAVGRCAFQECLFRINHPGEAPRRMMLPVRLVE